MAILVVRSPLLGVRKDFIGLAGFLEFFLCGRVVRISVWMMLHRFSTISLLDILFVGTFADAQHLIAITF
tara:strand:+ start:138 stop:347 length:210 start_codon:yes stop_codon:yes gene_type:complete